MPSRLGVDANCFVYYFDGVDQVRGTYLRDNLFIPLARGAMQAFASTLAMSDLLIPRLRHQGEEAARDLDLAVGIPGMSIVAVDLAVAFEAAKIRSATGPRLLDSVHVATAVYAGAEAFLTNDVQLSRASDFIPVLILDGLLRDQDPGASEHLTADTSGAIL